MTRALSLIVASVILLLAAPQRADAQPQLPMHSIPTWLPPLFDPVNNPNHNLTSTVGVPGYYHSFYDYPEFVGATSVFNMESYAYTTGAGPGCTPFTMFHKWSLRVTKDTAIGGGVHQILGTINEQYSGWPCLGIPGFDLTDWPASVAFIASVNADSVIAPLFPNDVAQTPAEFDWYFTLVDPEWELVSAEVVIKGWLPNPMLETYLEMEYSYDLVYEKRENNTVINRLSVEYRFWMRDGFSPVLWP